MVTNEGMLTIIKNVSKIVEDNFDEDAENEEFRLKPDIIQEI